MDDNIILVDLFDHEIGYDEKMKAHQRPVLHRAFSVFLYHGGKVLLQKRALGKYHSGGLWANTCCSHPRKGEELTEAVLRRLKEETGISCPVKEIGSFIYSYKFKEDLYECEYDHVFIGEYQGDVFPDRQEIEEMAWVDMERLAKRLAEHPQEYAPWFLTAYPMVLRAISPEGPASTGAAALPGH